MTLVLQKPLALIDIESTGINLIQDRIIEIAILKLFPDTKEQVKVFRVNPGIPIPEASTEYHHITDEDVKDSPSFKEKANEILEFIGNADLGGFNSNHFDIPILTEEFLRADIMFDTRNRNMLDVFKIFIKMEKRDLSSAYQFYCKKEMVNAHNAEADIRATYDILLAQLNKYDELENTVDFLHNFSKDGEYVDLGRKMVYKDGIPHFNFGKHKGRPVEDILRQEPQYYNWIMKNDFLSDTKQRLKEIKLMMKHNA